MLEHLSSAEEYLHGAEYPQSRCRSRYRHLDSLRRRDSLEFAHSRELYSKGPEDVLLSETQAPRL
jgi:hypothetical protein